MARCAYVQITLTLICFWAGSAVAPAADAPGLLLVDGFDDVQNELGGYRNPFQRAPSRVSASRVASEFHSASGTRQRGYSVQIQAVRAAEGYCGYWLHFFDFKAARKKYLDTRPYRFLSFWVKGARGGESFLIKLADRRWIEKDDSLAIGDVARFLPGGVTSQWREVVIPLDQLAQLDRQEMGGLTIEFTSPGEQVIYVDDVGFKQALQTSVRGSATNLASPVVGMGSLPRKLWVWKSESLLLDESAAAELFAFCARQQIDEIWLQLLYSLDPDRLGEHLGRRTAGLRYTDSLRKFLRRAHASGIRVHALDGAADYSQRAQHSIPLAVVDAVIAFNRDAQKQDERFDGVHFDNEPYLLLGWLDPELREQILLEFLELNAECQRRIRAESQMRFGIDIPFWWQETDARTGRAIGDVDFQGKRQAASFHCIAMLDNVGVMNYRDSADGADGMIAHGRGLLAFADQARRATLLMGVETFQSRDTPVCFVAGLPRQQFFAALRGAAEPLARNYTLRGFRLRTLDDGVYVHVGIEIPTGSLPARRRDAQQALLQLARQVGVESATERLSQKSLESASEFVQARAEWSEFRRIAINDRETGASYPGFRLKHSMLSKITFADDQPAQFTSEVRAAEAYFRRYHSFGGMAIHYYETFQGLVQREGN